MAKQRKESRDRRTDALTAQRTPRTNSFYDWDESLAKVQPTDNFRGRDPSHKELAKIANLTQSYSFGCKQWSPWPTFTEIGGYQVRFIVMAPNDGANLNGQSWLSILSFSKLADDILSLSSEFTVNMNNHHLVKLHKNIVSIPRDLRSSTPMQTRTHESLWVTW